LGRFPADFMFPLTRQEFNDLIFHFGRSSWGGTRKASPGFHRAGRGHALRASCGASEPCR
jgi:hypothetical protein